MILRWRATVIFLLGRKILRRIIRFYAMLLSVKYSGKGFQKKTSLKIYPSEELSAEESSGRRMLRRRIFLAKKYPSGALSGEELSG
jgi:hypothetical protein